MRDEGRIRKGRGRRDGDEGTGAVARASRRRSASASLDGKGIKWRWRAKSDGANVSVTFAGGREGNAREVVRREGGGRRTGSHETRYSSFRAAPAHGHSSSGPAALVASLSDATYRDQL